MNETAPLDPVEQMIKDNREGLGELQAQGLDVDRLIEALRLAVLVELLLPAGNPLRNTYNALFEANLAEHIVTARAQIARAKLTEGVKVKAPEGLAM